MKIITIIEDNKITGVKYGTVKVTEKNQKISERFNKTKTALGNAKRTYNRTKNK